MHVYAGAEILECILKVFQMNLFRGFFGGKLSISSVNQF